MDTVKSIKDVFVENTEGKLVLPNFQRGFQWKVYDQKKLLSTVLSMLPIGSILLLEGEKGDFSTRQLCYVSGDFKQKSECYYLLDGQQRMSTLRALFSNLFGTQGEWEGNYDNLYRDLRYRWFIDVRASENDDIFGFDTLNFKLSNIKKYEPSQFMENIKEYKITKQNKKEWYHPAYTNGLKGNKLKNHLADKASEENLIPLYNIYETTTDVEGKGLLEYTLEKLANKQVNELKAEVRDGLRDVTEILSRVEPDIEELDPKDDEGVIESAWYRLAADWSRNMLSYFKGLLEQKMHAIQLPADEISRATAIFESINRGGISLNTFDLIVAKAARIRSERTLTQKIVEQLEKDIELPYSLTKPLKDRVEHKWASTSMKTVEENKIANPIRDQFLSMLSLFSHLEYGNTDGIKIDFIKKEKQLSITPDQVNDKAEVTINSLIRACAFLQFRCGKLNVNDLNHKLMLLPLSYLLRNDAVWNSEEKLAKLEYWYWSSLFGGSYRERQNQRSIDDIKDLHAWVEGESKNPFENRKNKVLNYEGYSDLKVLLNEDKDNSIPAAIDRGILEFILSEQPRDFIFNENVEVFLSAWRAAGEEVVEFEKGKKRLLILEDHHIYPLGAGRTIGQSSKELRKKAKHILNSPLNRTYISSYSNMLISDHSPAEYIKHLKELTLWGHCINSNLNWTNDDENLNEEFYKSLLESRYKELKKAIKVKLDNLLRIKD